MSLRRLAAALLVLALGCDETTGEPPGVDAGRREDAGTSVADAAVGDAGARFDASAGADAAIAPSPDAGAPTDAGAAYAPCTSVDELAVPNGLTPASRQTTGRILGPLLPAGGPIYPLLEYTTPFGEAAQTYPPGEPDPTGFGFPGTNMNRLTFYVTRDRHVSLAFRVPTDPVWAGAGGSFFLIPNGAFVSAAIAPCPGQFADDPAHPMPAGCRAFGEASLPWRVGEVPGAGCGLLPGRTYYLNVINAPLDDPTASSCPSGECTFRIIESHIAP